MAGSFSQVDATRRPPQVEVPRSYNLAADLLDRHLAEGRGERVAVIDHDGSHSYAALGDRAHRFARLLRDLGLQPEQRVVLALLDSLEFPVCFLGAIYAGLVPVPVNTLLAADDYVYLLRDSRAQALVVSDALLSKLQLGIEAAPDCRHILVASSPLGGDRGRFPSLAALLEQTPPALAPYPSLADEVAFWLYSSGSTGKPKAAMHLAQSPIHTAALYAQGLLGMNRDDRIYSAAKLFFAYGLGNALTFPFSVGAAAVLTAERPTPKSVLAMMKQHQPTLFCGVPTLFAQILADPALDRQAGSQCLRLSISAGEALPQHVGERWRERFGSDILDGIGSTEMLHIFLSNRRDDVAYGTTGRPVPGYELKLVDDDGELASDESEGALWVRGPSSCSGYYADRARSLATFHGPWTRTGDRFRRDGDGRYTYCGRSDDLLKVGGIWVSPFEVESALAAHPAVLEAAVVGQADGEGLIKPKGYVVLKDSAAAGPELVATLQEFVKARLAPFKYPRWIEFLPELPKTATGKVQRFRLRG